MVLNSNSNIYGIGNLINPTNLLKEKVTKRFGFKFPIRDIDSGFFLKKSSGLDLIKSHLKQLLLTTRGERVMLPAYGTNLKKYLMEPLDQATLSQIKREIYETFTRYAPNVGITKLQVFPSNDETLSGGNALIIKLFCVLLDEDEINFDIKLDIR